MRRAVFLDRDGVINIDTGYIKNPREIVIYDDVIPFIKALQLIDYCVVIVTNQSGVARGLFSIEDAIEINEFVINKLNSSNILGYYMCPHYKEGIVKQYSIDCNCRKPKTGMIQAAKNDFQIELAHSFVIGDKETDCLMGKRAGLYSILLDRFSKFSSNTAPYLTAHSLDEAYTLITAIINSFKSE